jgi:hypothetical protein
MLPRIILACLILASLPLQAAPREWKSANGSRSIIGEFVKRDATSVTIRRADQKEVTIAFIQLHPEERFWTDANHPIAKTGGDIPQNKNTVFDELCFGDKRAEVLEKLKASQIVELTVAETFLGRTGLNDVFRTRKKIGGLTASLFFDWTEDGGLKEITLQTPEVPAGKFNEQLKPSWEEFIKLLTNLHGKPVTSSSGLDLASVPDGGMLPTHLWKLQGTGTAMLGASRDGAHFHVVVRFTRKEVQPVEITVPGIR